MSRSSDGATLLVTSSDGFCSAISFSPTDLGEVFKGDPQKRRQEAADAAASTSEQTTPLPTPISQFAPPSPFPGSQHRQRDSMSSLTAPSPPAANFVSQRPSSPARSNSTSSIMTQTSVVPAGPHNLVGGSVPSLTATNSGKVTGPTTATPPETPRSGGASAAGQKRDLSESESGREDPEQRPKKKRIAPTFVSGLGGSDSNP